MDNQGWQRNRRGLTVSIQHENDFGGGIDCPPAPLMLPVPLPAIGGASPSIAQGAATEYHSNQTAPGVLLREMPWVIDFTLDHREALRPVAEAVVSDMLAYEGHLWGAASEDVWGTRNGRTVHFADIARPATNPAVARLTIITGFCETIVVNPRVGSNYVAVGDTQRAVVVWMRQVEQIAQSHGQSAGLSRRGTVRARDGTRMNVDLWVWRGLSQVGTRVDLLTLEL